MTTWRVIELAKAGYADYKPPYDFKHGWIPVSGAAKKAVPDAASSGGKKRVSKPEDVTDEIKAKLPPMLKQKTWQHNTEQDWLNAVNDYMGKHPEGFGAPSKPRQKVKVEAGADGLTESQRHALELAGQGKDPVDAPSSVGSTLMREWTDSVKVKGELTEDEDDAVARYQWGEPEYGFGSSIYEELNDYKRNGSKGRSDDSLDELDSVHEGMLTAVSKSRTATPVTVFRGLRDGQPPVKVGDTLTDRAWVSTTFDPFIAHTFAKLGEGGLDNLNNKVQVISLPKGHPALRALSGEEMELTLPPDTPLRVVREDGRYQYLEPVK